MWPALRVMIERDLRETFNLAASRLIAHMDRSVPHSREDALNVFAQVALDHHGSAATSIRNSGPADTRWTFSSPRRARWPLFRQKLCA